MSTGGSSSSSSASTATSKDGKDIKDVKGLPQNQQEPQKQEPKSQKQKQDSVPKQVQPACYKCHGTKKIKCTCIEGIRVMPNGRQRKCLFCDDQFFVRCPICTKCKTCLGSNVVTCKHCYDGNQYYGYYGPRYIKRSSCPFCDDKGTQDCPDC